MKSDKGENYYNKHVALKEVQHHPSVTKVHVCVLVNRRRKINQTHQRDAFCGGGIIDYFSFFAF